MPHSMSYRQIIRNLILTGVCSAILSALAVIWLASDETNQNLLFQSSIDYSSPDIKQVRLQMEGNIVVLYVITRRAITCEDVYRILSIDAFSLNNELYVPSCVTSDSHLIKISYTKSTSS